MDRSFRDNPSRSQDGRRGLHTYTPRSHEDLLRSHLQLDAARKNKLQNDLQRLSAENDRLRRELDKANQDILDKDNQINFLNNELKNKGRPPSPVPTRTYIDEKTPVFELDGKQVTLDNLLHHFSVIIDRHHELINLKNRQIQQLKDELDNNRHVVRVPHRREAETQSPRFQDTNDFQQNLTNEFSRQLALIRKEYEQVEHLLTERNNRLENLIKELQNKLDQYQKEIQYLRNELANQGGTQEPNESTMKLIREKEKENRYLKEVISKLQRPNNFVIPDNQNMNEDLINEIKKVISGKQDAIHKLNDLITDIKKDNVGDNIENPDMSEVEKDCENMLTDLNNMKDKLNIILLKLKDSPTPVQGEPIDKNNLISNLENLKKQCQDEIDNLEKQIGPTGAKSSPDLIVMKGHAVLKLDDPSSLMKKPLPPGTESGEALPDDPVQTVSNMRFAFYPLSKYPQPSKERVFPAEQPSETYEYPARPLEEKPPTPEAPVRVIQKPQESYPPKHKHYSPIPCEACHEVPSDRSVQHLSKIRQQSIEPLPPRKEPQRTYAEEPSKSRSRTPRKKSSPTPPPKKKLIEDFYSPSSRAKSKDKAKKKKGGGCCGNKGSTTSNVPYEKYPDEEKVMNVHSPYRGEDYQNLYPVLDKDDYTYELSSPGPQVRSKTPKREMAFKKTY